MTGNLHNVSIFHSFLIALIQKFVKGSWQLAARSFGSCTTKFHFGSCFESFLVITHTNPPNIIFFQLLGFCLALTSGHVDISSFFLTSRRNENKSCSVLRDQIGSVVVSNTSWWSKMWAKKTFCFLFWSTQSKKLCFL